MRVVVVTGTSAPGGPVSHALHLAEDLARRGVATELVMAAADGPVPAAPEGVPLTLVGAREALPGDPDAAAEERVARLAEALADIAPPDVLHAEDAVAGTAALQVRTPASRVVRTVHHLDAAPSDTTEELQRRSIQAADATVSASRYWAERIRDLFGVDAAVIPNGVDVDRFAAPLDREEAKRLRGWDGRPAVLGLGGIERRKGSRLLLEAFARARSRVGEDPLLVVVGGGGSDDAYARAFHEDAERFGLRVGEGSPEGADVLLLAPVPEEAMPGLIHAVDLLALPSTREGSPLVVLEAAAAGRPAVVSDLDSLRETLRPGEDVLMVPTGEVAPLSDAIVRLVHEHELSARLAESAAEVARSAGWDRAGAAYADLYARVCAGG